MRQLLPHPIDDVDPLDLHLADRREPHADRPWLLCNMIASIDGATALDGRSGDLGAAGDKAVFRALRASCDWVVVASSTAATERYRMPQTSPELTARRAEHGRPPAPNLAIVTASGRVDPTIPALAARTDDQPRPLILTGRDADPAALDLLDADIVRLDTATPEPEPLLRELARRGARVALTEGGPTFNGVLHDAGVFDEFCLSLAPFLVGGHSIRAVADGQARVRSMHLARLLEEAGTLFARYLAVPAD